MFSMFTSVGACAFVSVCICAWVYVRVGVVEGCEKSMKRMCEKVRGQKRFLLIRSILFQSLEMYTLCTFDHIFAVEYLL